MYVSAKNGLYQLTSDLDVMATVQIGPPYNINKVLLIDYSSKQLITCDSIQGQCLTRNLQNISLPHQSAVSAIVSTSESKFFSEI